MKFAASLLKTAVFAVVFALCTSGSSTFAQQKKGPQTFKGYGAASYSTTDNGQFMSTWLVAGPLTMDKTSGNPELDKQKEFFKEDGPAVTVAPGKQIAPVSIKGSALNWQLVKAGSDIVDLDKQFNKIDFAAAFALAEIKSDVDTKAILSVGSDDGIRIWHDGKLIHDNWIPRGVNKDEDLVPIALHKGSNQILLKVQDIQQGWGFAIRVLGKDQLGEKLVESAGLGKLDELRLLLSCGADVEHINTSGLSALGSAQLHGREEVVNLLLEKGAKNSAIPALDKLVEGLYSQLKGKDAAGIAVLVAQGDKVLYKNGFGYADIANKELIKTDTKFRIGSVTKQFTGAAILKLQEEGKISVNDKLSKFLPGFPRADEVTIHQLLTHTSGIHSYTSKSEFITKVTSPISEENLIDFFKNDSYDFNPGEDWSYSNSGYFILGHIVGKVTGKTYADYLAETFFKPLGMTNTGIHSSTIKLENEAKGHAKDNDKYIQATNWDMSWAGGAGAIFSTVEDLHKWNEALHNGKVLKAESLQAGFAPVTLSSGKKPALPYGYGWIINDFRGQKVIEHSGGLHGFISQLSYYPKERLTIALLTNLSPPELMINSNIIAEYVLWERMDKQESHALNASVAENVKAYEGRYDFGNGMVMLVTSDGNDLFAQLTGQPRFQIFPSAPGAYFWKVVDAKIRFEKDEIGRVLHGVFEQNGNKMTVPKLKDETIVSIDKALFKLYAGKYDYGNNFIITISEENEKLFVQGTNQPKFEMFPLSEREFMTKEVNARLTFDKQANGKVSKLVLDMAGTKKDAPKIE